LAKTLNGNYVAIQQTESRADILPPPAEMERYEALYPGITRILIDTYTAQVNHRIELETTVIEGDNKRATRGQVISAAIAFICICMGGALTYFDKNVGGLSLIFGSLGTLLTAFYGGAIIRRKERKEKNTL
jgi:uncharacterized membrane protein